VNLDSHAAGPAPKVLGPTAEAVHSAAASAASAPERRPALDVTGLAKRFGRVVALRDAALRVLPGEVHALMGANGAGKSTLVKMLTGAIQADSGEILVNGRRCAFRSPREASEGGVVSVYQDPALVPDLNIRDNFRIAGVSLSAAGDWFQRFGLGRVGAATFARDLSAAQLRMVDLARALAANPEVLLLDEITASLSADMAALAFEAVREWRDRGRAVLFISHRLAEVSSICDRATVLRDGVTVGVVDPVAGREIAIVDLMLGPGRSEGGVHERKAVRSQQGSALAVRDLSVEHQFREVSFTLRKGEVLGIAALEGQGQHGLFECLAGLRVPDSGTIERDGRCLTLGHPADAIDAGIALVPADRSEALLPHRSIRENVMLPGIRHVASWLTLSTREDRARATEAIARLQIDTRAEAEVRLLSGGNQQKVVIARWIAAGFDVLLCYDPTRGIDIGTKRQIYDLLRDVAADGAAVLLYTSEFSEIRVACDRALVMFAGRLAGEMPASEADETSLLALAHGLVSTQAGAEP